MIERINIENFRCFEKTTIAGFQRMNLITGKNNSGKTALLEAIYFNLCSQKDIMLLSRDQVSDNNHYNNLYFNRNTSENITINCHDHNDVKYESKLLVSNSIGDVSPYALQIATRFIFDKNYQLPERDSNIVELFDYFFLNGGSKIIQEAIQTIDKSIVEIRTVSSIPNVLFLKKEGQEQYMPINYFGDAIKKIVRYVINIISLSRFEQLQKILLIDEIENGLHYTAQEEFWQMLFRLCIKFDIQVFATTHSLEMIKTYQQVATEFEGEAAYFEMARHAKNNQIVGFKHEMETLEYALETNAKIRGEL